MSILIIFCAVLYLINAIRSKDPLTVIIALIGFVIWVLHCFGALPKLPACFLS